MRGCWMLFLVAGCGRIGFDAKPPDSGGVLACARFGAWSAPVLASTLSSARGDFGPALSTDGLEVVFHSDRAGGPGGFDLFRATRPDRASEFGQPQVLAGSSSPQNDENATLSADGMTIYFTSERTGALSVYRATRPDLASPFAAPERLDALGDLDGPELSADGTELFGSRPSATHDLYRVTDFTSATPVSERLTSISTDGRNEFYPAISADGLTLYFEIGGMHIHRAQRSAIGTAFVYEGLDPAFSSTEDDTDPDISHDGRTFMFGSLRGGTSFDLFISQRDCE